MQKIEDERAARQADEERAKNDRLMKKASRERALRAKRAAVAKRAGEVHGRIIEAISRLEKDIIANPTQTSLLKLQDNYKHLEARAQALSQLMTNPHEHIEEHSIEDHHDVHHDIQHDGIVDAHLDGYHRLHHEVSQISADARKLNGREGEYRSNHRRRTRYQGGEDRSTQWSSPAEPEETMGRRAR